MELTRRDFLKKATLLIGGIAVAAAPLSEFAYMVGLDSPQDVNIAEIKPSPRVWAAPSVKVSCGPLSAADWNKDIADNLLNLTIKKTLVDERDLRFKKPTEGWWPIEPSPEKSFVNKTNMVCMEDIPKGEYGLVRYGGYSDDVRYPCGTTIETTIDLTVKGEAREIQMLKPTNLKLELNGVNLFEGTCWVKRIFTHSTEDGLITEYNMIAAGL